MGSWSKDPSTIIKRAKENGVDSIICPGIDVKTSQISLKIANKFEGVYSAAGVHPHDAKDADENYIDKLKDLLTKQKMVAVGEIGLDFYRNISPASIQRTVFYNQVQLAQELDLPIIIHNRNADVEIIELLKDFGKVKGVAHCFSSDLKMAEMLLELGLYISFAGNLTYKNNNLSEVSREIPLERILIETDSPYLSPVPFRGKENEPSRVRLVAEKLAEYKDVELKTIIQATYSNSVSLFNIISN
jgi:TatD DNase family protein